jgi:hypothetical protein
VALLDKAFYVSFGDGSTTGYYAATKWTSGATAVAGQIIRQFTAPAAGSERCFVCIAGGAVGAVEPTWILTRGAKNVSSSAIYQECSGVAALNGDLTNTPNWVAYHAIGTAGTLGQVVKDAAGTHIFIMSTAGTIGGSEPSWNTAAVGNTTTDNGATWTYLGTSFGVLASPHARTSSSVASTWGDGTTQNQIIFVADNHVEVSTVISITLHTNQKLLSFDHTIISAPPTVCKSGASISATANGSACSIAGFGYVNGITFQGSTGIGSGNVINVASGSNNVMYFKNCALTLRGTGTTSITVGNAATGALIVFDNVVATFTVTTTNINLVGGFFIWKNTTAAVAWTTSQPNKLLAVAAGAPGCARLEALDLSNFTNTICTALTTSYSLNILRCKLNPSVNISQTPSFPSAGFTDNVSSDSGAETYRTDRIRYEGNLATETTIIRTGGANDGSSAMSYKIVTNANCSWNQPFESVPLVIWNDIVGSPVTLTVYGVWGGGAVPLNSDCWIEVEYLSEATHTTGSITSTGQTDPLTTGTNCDTDGSSIWGGSTTPFAMHVTITPQARGPIYVYPKMATALTTFYLDPNPILS